MLTERIWIRYRKLVPPQESPLLLLLGQAYEFVRVSVLVLIQATYVAI